jgi:hypothetical protein
MKNNKHNPMTHVIFRELMVAIINKEFSRCKEDEDFYEDISTYKIKVRCYKTINFRFIIIYDINDKDIYFRIDSINKSDKIEMGKIDFIVCLDGRTSTNFDMNIKDSFEAQVLRELLAINRRKN